MYRKIILAGGSGFLGQVLIDYYKEKVDQTIVLTRRQQANQGNIVYVPWDGKTLDNWHKCLESSDMLINLVGKNVNCRYTEKNKKEIINSRIEATEILGKAIQNCTKPPKLWINAASATIYRHADDRPQDEVTGEIGHGFSVDVCKAWEDRFWKAETDQTRKVLLRVGMVLGREDGVFPYLRRLVYFGLGGYQGSGKQYVSWIHQLDFCRITEWFLQHETETGTFNCTAPDAITNKEFMRLLRKGLGFPSGIASPKWLLEIGARVIGTETELVLKSRWVIPKHLLDAGFRFSYPAAQAAISDLSSFKH